jgi:YidC/Oxa1 family membrane protein insertase
VSEIILTQYNGKILGPIAKVLGWIMNGIYYVLNSLFGIENIGLCIIILTLIIYACLFPLTYKQQKFSKLSQKMNPELQAIQKKYNGKRDQVSMQKMQEETQMVYQKYGVSPTGSCIQMLIQMPILFALYRVFLNVPAYVPAVKEKFSALVTEIMSVDGFADKMTSFVDKIKIAGLSVDFTATDTNVLHNYIVDVLYKMNTSGWGELTKVFGNLTNLDATEKSLEKLNYFLGLNISNSPWNIMTTGFKSGAYLLAIGALMIPVISFLTQRLNIKLMPTASTGENDAMAQQMKTMNFISLSVFWLKCHLTFMHNNPPPLC